MSVHAELWPYFALIVAGFLPNEVWRWLGLLASRGLDEDSQIIVWVRAVATAILAGVIAQLMTTSRACSPPSRCRCAWPRRSRASWRSWWCGARYSPA